MINKSSIIVLTTNYNENNQILTNLKNLFSVVPSNKYDIYIYINIDHNQELKGQTNYCQKLIEECQKYPNIEVIFKSIKDFYCKDTTIPHSLINNYDDNIESNRLYIGHSIFYLLDMYHKFDDYDNYIFYEDDVYIKSDEFIFENESLKDTDIIIHKQFDINRYWFWRDDPIQINKYHLGKLKPFSYVNQIFILFSFSNKFMKFLIRNVIDNEMCGHHEIIYSTVINYAKFCTSLGKHRFSIKYLESYYKLFVTHDEYLTTEQISKINKLSNNVIVHPVKSESFFNKFLQS